MSQFWKRQKKKRLWDVEENTKSHFTWTGCRDKAGLNSSSLVWSCNHIVVLLTLNHSSTTNPSKPIWEGLYSVVFKLIIWGFILRELSGESSQKLKKNKSAEDSLSCGTQSPLHEYQEKVGAPLQLEQQNPGWWSSSRGVSWLLHAIPPLFVPSTAIYITHSTERQAAKGLLFRVSLGKRPNLWMLNSPNHRGLQN